MPAGSTSGHVTQTTRSVWAGLLGASFLLIGFLKIYAPTHAIAEHNIKQFNDFSQHFPTNLMGLSYHPDPRIFRLLLGAIEMALGIIVLLNPPSAILKFCYVIKIVIMLGAISIQMSRGLYTMALIPSAFIVLIIAAWRVLSASKQYKND